MILPCPYFVLSCDCYIFYNFILVTLLKTWLKKESRNWLHINYTYLICTSNMYDHLTAIVLFVLFKCNHTCYSGWLVVMIRTNVRIWNLSL